MDERIKKLAKVLVHHSCRVQKGEKVYLNYVGADTKPLARHRSFKTDRVKRPNGFDKSNDRRRGHKPQGNKSYREKRVRAPRKG